MTAASRRASRRASEKTITSPTELPCDPIVALRECRTGREIALPSSRRRIRVGSSRTSDVVLADPFVSADHCMLEQRAPGRTLVRDRRSTNGTFINGNRVELAELRPGGMLRLGETRLIALGAGRPADPSAWEQLRGQAPAFRRAVDMAMRAAHTDCSVLIIGETGTGKELVARAIHEMSPRSEGPMTAVNCGAIANELIGSELFGHEKGAFTGATAARDGVFVQASGGTLFLDELGELPMEQQPHLLRVLETRRVRPIGGNREQPVDVRLIAATNRLENLGTPSSPLRLDVFHRLATVVVHLPPLRERKTDIPLLVDSFIDELSPAFGRRTIGRHTMNELIKYTWPGNVRELRQAIKRAMALCPNELTLDQLLPHVNRYVLDPRGARSQIHRGSPRASSGLSGDLRPIDHVIRDVLLDALDRHPSIRTAAQSLGMAKSTFADWARRLDIALS